MLTGKYGRLYIYMLRFSDGLHHFNILKYSILLSIKNIYICNPRVITGLNKGDFRDDFIVLYKTNPIPIKIGISSKLQE